MTLWKNIVSYFKRESTPAKNAYEPRGGAVEIWPSHSSDALAIGAVYRCVDLLSKSVAVLPMQCMHRKGTIYVNDESDMLWYLLNVQPDNSLSAFDLWRQSVVNVLLDGNAYIVPVYSSVSMNVDRLVLCGRGTVSHNTITDKYFVCDSVNGVFGTFDESEIIHLKGSTVNDPKVGVSVLTYAKMTADIASSGDREALKRFVLGGNVRGFVSNEKGIGGFGPYADEALDEVAAYVDGRLSGGGRIFSLPGRVEFQQLSLSSTDMQFLESRKFTVREICRFFGVHPTFVFDDTSNNYKSAEQADVNFLKHTLDPLLKNIESELNRKLIPRALCHKRKFQFDRRGLYACDLEGQMKYRGLLLQTGTSVNELRIMDNRPPVDGGDIVFVSTNLRGIKEIGVQPQQPEAPENKDNDNDDEKG